MREFYAHSGVLRSVVLVVSSGIDTFRPDPVEVCLLRSLRRGAMQ
jgi:hypothetical protein